MQYLSLYFIQIKKLGAAIVMVYVDDTLAMGDKPALMYKI